MWHGKFVRIVISYVLSSGCASLYECNTGKPCFKKKDVRVNLYMRTSMEKFHNAHKEDKKFTHNPRMCVNSLYLLFGHPMSQIQWIFPSLAAFGKQSSDTCKKIYYIQIIGMDRIKCLLYQTIDIKLTGSDVVWRISISSHPHIISDM